MMDWRRSCFLIAAIVALAASVPSSMPAQGGQSQESAQKPPASAFGTYTGAKCPTSAPSGCVSGSAKDRLVISRGKDGKANATVRLVFDRGFSCAVKGEAQWIDDHFLVRADGLDPAKPCQLELLVDKGFIQLHDAGGFCQQVYCGAGAALDGARFEKVRQKSSPQTASPSSDPNGTRS